ncbi:MAG: hypothetical protein M3R40_00890 [Pseudomonadota bacterium]|nr:hypothetical protein [Pseudomonadota bacterium]
MTQFDCNLGQPEVPLPHVWSHPIGSRRVHLALRADWQAQMRRVRAELGCRHVRFHAILSDDMGTVLIGQNQLLHGFYNADQIFDFLVGIGMRPFVELSFMPTALASGEKTVFSFRGDITPPRDYEQWATLIRTLVSHWVVRYGADEVRQWFFEVWNEPNLSAFWSGGQDGYFTLYRTTVKATNAVDSQLHVGGPASASDGWIKEFVDFCEREGLPADFVSTHHYPIVAWLERIDENHCNPRRLWESLGSSPYPDPAELDALRAASELRREVVAVQDTGDGIVFHLDVPPDGIACITLEFAT